MKQRTRAEIIVKGLVQGVGFRYFSYSKAKSIGLNGFVKNEYDGTVRVVVEGTESDIMALISQLKIGPQYSDVRDLKVTWKNFAAEFSSFEIRGY